MRLWAVSVVSGALVGLYTDEATALTRARDLRLRWTEEKLKAGKVVITGEVTPTHNTTYVLAEVKRRWWEQTLRYAEWLVHEIEVPDTTRWRV